MSNQNLNQVVERQKVRDVEEHLTEIQSLFLDRLEECHLTDRTKGIDSIPEAFEILSDPTLSEGERADIISSLGMALSDATESLLFEYLLYTGYYKNESEFCNDGETSYGLIEDDGEPYLDMRLKSEVTVYVQLQARQFTDPDYSRSYFQSLLFQLDMVRKEKVALQFSELRDDLQKDIEGLEIQWEAAESTGQLDELRKERFESELYVLRKVHKKLDEVLLRYYGVYPEEKVAPKLERKPSSAEIETAVVSFTRSMTIDVPTGMDEQTIKELAVTQFNSLDPEDRNMSIEHATLVEMLGPPKTNLTKSKPVILLSAMTDMNQWCDEVENFQFVSRDSEVIIDVGFYLEVYTNPDGVFEEEQTSNGSSTFIYVDEETDFTDLLDLFEEEGKIRDQTLTVRVIPSEDKDYERERGFAKENLISTLKTKRVAMVLSKITEIAESVRRLLEDKYGSEYMDFQGKSVEASDLISAELNKQKIEHQIVSGWIMYDDASGCSNRDFDEHTWVEAGDIFIDVTLTQYEPFMFNPIPSVIVGEKPQFLAYGGIL